MKLILICVGVCIAVILVAPILFLFIVMVAIRLAFMKDEPVEKPVQEEYSIPKGLNFFIYQKTI